MCCRRGGPADTASSLPCHASSIFSSTLLCSSIYATYLINHFKLAVASGKFCATGGDAWHRKAKTTFELIRKPRAMSMRGSGYARSKGWTQPCSSWNKAACRGPSRSGCWPPHIIFVNKNAAGFPVPVDKLTPDRSGSSQVFTRPETGPEARRFAPSRCARMPSHAAVCSPWRHFL